MTVKKENEKKPRYRTVKVDTHTKDILKRCRETITHIGYERTNRIMMDLFADEMFKEGDRLNDSKVIEAAVKYFYWKLKA